jgi:putative membrane protein
LPGIITGLTPGIHVNLISLLLLSVSPFLLGFTSALVLACFIIAMAVTHTFLDTIPSVFLGAPESATALGVLPGHRYLLKGNGVMAVKLTIIGSYGAMILSVILFPLFIIIVKNVYAFIKDYIGYFLLVIAIFMIFRDKKLGWAIFVFVVSGILGLIVLNIPNFGNPLFPMLSGLFGLSTLIYSLKENEKIPKQNYKDEIKMEKGKSIKALFSGTFSGFLTAVLPGIGAATAAVISMQITRKLGDHGFMVLIGGISTVNFVLSLVSYLVIDKARNGAIIVVRELVGGVTINHILIFICALLIAGSVAVFLALFLSKVFAKLISVVNYKKLVLGIIFLIIILTFILTNWLGLLVLLISTAIGLLPAITKVTRTHGMACLLVPVMSYFLL